MEVEKNSTQVIGDNKEINNINSQINENKLKNYEIKITNLSTLH